MSNRSKILFGVLIAGVLVLAGCSSQASSSTQGSSQSSGSPSSSSSGLVNVDAEDIVSILLDYNAGTGYEWTYTAEPANVVSFEGKATEDLAKGQALAGGALRDTFTFRAAQAGEVVLTFELKRSWNDDVAETAVYAFTVDNDLKMVLNPYKSNFQNEPVWGSNS